MEDLLRSKGLYQITMGTETAPTDDDKKAKWNNRNDEARGLIGMSISPDLRYHLQGVDDPEEAWDKIESVFGKLNIIRAQQLENQILTLNPSDFSCLGDYLSKFKTLRLLCIECNIKMKEPRCIFLILSKLGSAYSVFVSTFYAMKEALGEAYVEPTLESFCTSLIREEDKLLQLGVIKTADTSNKALVAQQKDKPKYPKKQNPRYNNKQPKVPKPAQIASAPNGDKGSKYKKNTNKHCNFCNKDGHDEFRCFKKMAALEAAMKKHNISIDSSSSSHGHALSAFGFSFNTPSTTTSSSDEWLIDSGASYHMAKDKAIFSGLNECNTKQIFVGDDRSLSVVGSGTIQVQNGHFNDVLCVPDLSCNLLSVYQITHSGEGKTVEFSPHQVVIKDLKDPKHVLATGIADDITRLYKFDNFGSSAFSSVFVAHSDDLSKLWHERFGHLNYRSLQQLCNQQMVTGLPLVSCRDGVCAGCVLGKHHRDSFDKRASWHASGPLQLVHSDLCGPLSSPSFSGCKYFLTFIDDFSRRTWFYFLKLKSEVFDKFLAYKALVEKQSGHQIQRLRTDNGGEYVNNNFTSYCTTQGIQMQHTVPYTPQQNGVAERKNRTLKEMANCMIQSKGLSLQYWAEAINCANYIVNRTPTKALKNITPEEAWTKIKPDVSHFRVFGSIAWAHIPDEKRKALQPKSEKCIFVGYSEDVKGYRLLQPHCNEIILRRDVKFDENLLACEPNSAGVPSLACEPSSADVPSSVPILDSSSDDESEGENTPPPADIPPDESFEPEQAPVPLLPRWVRSTREAAGDLVGDPSDQRRTRSQFQRASSLLAQVSETHDPETFAEASGHPDWDTAMNEEYRSLMENDTWDLVPLPKGRKLVRCKWVYRTKYASDGSIERHKARLVAKGFSQVEGIDYNETFAPVAKMNSIRLVLALAASHKWEVHQMDVKSAFLHGDLKEEIYMEQPPGYVQNDSSLVCRLKKSLYGLKQAPRAWYAKMDSFLIATGFSRCHSDPNVYTKKVGNHLIILVLYVDDLILTGSDSKLLNHVKTSLKKKFEMTDLGFLHYFLGLQVLQTNEGIFLSQSKYACDLLRRFHMDDCKPAPSPFHSGVKLSATCTSPEVDATLYRQLVGSLLYLTHTRPDLSFAVGLVARYMQTPHESHWKAAKRILRYVRGTVQFGIHYSSGGTPLLVGFTDSDWAGDPDDRKSTAGYVFSLGSGPVTWACKKQQAIALSSAEAEYRAAVNASQEALWLRQILSEFGFQHQHPTRLWCDNQSSIKLAKDPVQHQRSKHIELHMHFIRNLIHDQVIEVLFCPTEDQVADIFTKSLTEAKFSKLRSMLGVQEVVIKGG
jgi:transposase InsO family protein